MFWISESRKLFGIERNNLDIAIESNQELLTSQWYIQKALIVTSYQEIRRDQLC